ncbi:MAG: tetratricopeptide repeat protein [Ignavibacteriae bacterium]|nr:tetratricopeptide repeat protein [Ignavibacteria bacterium]MBI3365202.1 tetratricopeptide repeat protein [Ignavibacteriota bacterium]
MTSNRFEILKNFLDDDPKAPFNHYALALEYVTQQQFPEAIAKFEDVIVLDPNYVPAYHQLGLLYAQLNRQEEALTTLEKGIQIAALVGDTHAQTEMQEAIDELGL